MSTPTDPKKEPSFCTRKLFEIGKWVISAIVMAIIIPIGLTWRSESKEAYKESVRQEVELQAQKSDIKSIYGAVRDLTDNVNALAADKVGDLRERLIQLELYTANGPYFTEEEADREIEDIQKRLTEVKILIEAEKSKDYSGRNLVVQKELQNLTNKIILLESNSRVPEQIIQGQLDRHFQKFHKD